MRKPRGHLLHLSPGCHTRSFSVFWDRWFFQVPWSENTLVPGISKPKIPLVSYSSCFHFLVHPSHMCDPSNFLCYGLCLVLLYSLSEGHPHCGRLLSSSGVRLRFPFTPALQSRQIAGVAAGMMFLSTRSRGAGGRFTQGGWAACS